MPYKRSYRRKRTRFKRKKKKYYKSKKKYYKKKRISKRSYRLNRQQLLSVATVKKIAKRVLRGNCETILSLRSALDIQPNNAGYSILKQLDIPTGAQDSLVHDTPDVVRIVLMSPADITQGVGHNQISGSQFILKSVMFKCRFLWQVKAETMGFYVSWFLIKTKATPVGVADYPRINANLFKNSYWADSERVYSRNRKIQGITVLKRGRIYPPRKATAPINGAQQLQALVVTPAGQTTQLVHQQPLLIGAGGVQSTPYTTKVYSTKTFYWKFNKKVKTITLPQDITVHDRLTNVALKSGIPFRTYLVMFMNSFPSGNIGQERKNEVAVKIQKTVWYCDD